MFLLFQTALSPGSLSRYSVKDPAERGLVCLEFEPTTSRMERPQCISYLLCVHSIRLLKPRPALKIIKQLHVRQTNRIIDHSLWENVVSQRFHFERFLVKVRVVLVWTERLSRKRRLNEIACIIQLSKD